MLPQGSGLSVREPQRMLQGVLGWEVHNTASEVLQQLEHSQPSSPQILRLWLSWACSGAGTTRPPQPLAELSCAAPVSLVL